MEDMVILDMIISEIIHTEVYVSLTFWQCPCGSRGQQCLKQSVRLKKQNAILQTTHNPSSANPSLNPQTEERTHQPQIHTSIPHMMDIPDRNNELKSVMHRERGRDRL